MKPSHCPLCHHRLNLKDNTPGPVDELLGDARALYQHLAIECPYDSGTKKPQCTVCGWPPPDHTFGWSNSFLLAVHWTLTQDLDPIEHIIRSSLGELFLPQEAIR